MIKYSKVTDDIIVWFDNDTLEHMTADEFLPYISSIRHINLVWMSETNEYKAVEVTYD